MRTAVDSPGSAGTAEPARHWRPGVTDWPTISSLATAGGTLVLATAGGTLVLATATFASVRSGNRTARTAERSLWQVCGRC